MQRKPYFLQNKWSCILCSLGFPLYQVNTVLYVAMLIHRLVFENMEHEIELQVDFNSTKFFLPNLLQSLFMWAWFLKIDPVRIVGMCACVCVCVRTRGY